MSDEVEKVTKTRSPDEVAMIQDLIAKIGLNPQEISEALEGRVSSRTIYRWKQGESFPQQKSDIEALQELAGRVKS